MLKKYNFINIFKNYNLSIISELLSLHKSVFEKHKLIIFFLISSLIICVFLETISLGFLIPLFSLLVEQNTDQNNNILFINFIKYFEYDPILVASVVVLIVYSIKNFFLFLNIFFQTNITHKFQHKLSTVLFHNSIKSDLNLSLKLNSSKFIQYLTNEVSQINGAMLSFLQLVSELAITISIAIFLFYLNPELTLIVFSVLLFSSFLFYFLSRKKLTNWGKRRLEADGDRIRKIQDAYNLIKEIKIYKKFEYIKNLFSFPNKVSALMGRNQVILQNIPRLWTELFAIFSFMLAIIYLLTTNSDLSNLITDLGVFGAATFRLMPSANKILSCIHTFRYAAPSILTISSLLSELKKNNYLEAIDTKDNKNFSFLNEIRINEINFSYNQNLIFKNFSSVIKKNEVTCIIGESGKGKSTLINILLGFLPLKSGSISIDDVLLNRDNIHKWHDIISYVPQSVILFQGTLKENIIFGDQQLNYDEKLIYKSIELANLSDFVNSLPLGIETMVDEKGSNFSGGQIQRIGIARALYRKPELLIFDEPTSSLDSETEMKLISEILRLKNHASIIIVTHNHNIIDLCDNSINLNEKNIN